MNNGGDAAEQVVRLSLEGFEVAAKLTGSAAKNVALLLVSVLKQEQQTKGKARLTNMIKSGKELKVFSIPNKDLAQFTKQAKRYGVLYCVLRDKSAKGDDVPVDIIARAEDASKIQRIVERFEIGKVDKAGVITQAEQDKWTPSNVSRNSMKVVWWKCGAGHSYRAKIADRTIEQKGCPQCEAEFQQALPQMLIMMYGAQNGITVKSNSDSELGMRLVAYLPELHCAVDIAGATVTEKREQSVKAHICQSNRLGYYLIKRTTDTSQMAAEIKTLFIRNHIYLHTDSEKDVQVLRERFLEWKNRNACKLNGKY